MSTMVKRVAQVARHDRRRLGGEMSDCVPERMRWLVKQFELSGQQGDTQIRLAARQQFGR